LRIEGYDIVESSLLERIRVSGVYDVVGDGWREKKLE